MCIRSAIRDRLLERQLIKDLRIRGALDGLSQFEVNLIQQNRHLRALAWAGPSIPAAVAMALPALLQKRILRLETASADGSPAVDVWTTFGRAVADSLSAPRQ
jgi:hypothetical protein